MKTNHTPAPWRHANDGVVIALEGISGYRGRGNQVAQFTDDKGHVQPQQTADAQRAVDCVNACEGIDPTAIALLISAASNAVKAISIQYDNLNDMPASVRHAYSCLIDALDKAEGGAE